MKVFLITFRDGSEDTVKAHGYEHERDFYVFRGENGNVHRFRADDVRSIQETDPQDWQPRGGGSY